MWYVRASALTFQACVTVPGRIGRAELIGRRISQGKRRDAHLSLLAATARFCGAQNVVYQCLTARRGAISMQGRDVLAVSDGPAMYPIAASSA